MHVQVIKVLQDIFHDFILTHRYPLINNEIPKSKMMHFNNERHIFTLQLSVYCPFFVLSLGKSFAQEIKTYPDNE